MRRPLPALYGALALSIAAAPAMAQAPAGEKARAPGQKTKAAESPPEKQLSAQEQAAVYFKEGRAFFKAKDYRAAAEKFQAAYNLDPVPILLYNMARAAEEMGDPEQAIGHYRSYITRVGPDAEDRGEVERRIRVMEKTIAAARRARIRIAGLPPNAKITVDGQPTELEDGLVRAEPGERLLKVIPVDGKAWEKALGLATGEYVEVVFGETNAPEPPPPPSGPSVTAIAGWSAVGAGALFGVLGAVFYADASGAADDWQRAVDLLEITEDAETQRALIAQKDDAFDTRESKGTMAYVMWGLGGAALAAGGALLYLEYVHEGAPAAEASVVPLPGGVGLIGRF